MKKILLTATVLCLTMAYALKPSYPAYNVYEVKTNKIIEEPEDSPEQSSYKFGDYLIVTTKTVNVRKGAGSDYGVVQTIRKNGLLKFLSSNGNWHKVMVVGTDRVGYVYYRNVK